MMVKMILRMIIIASHLYDYDDMRMIIFSSDLYDAAGNLEPLIEANLQPSFVCKPRKKYGRVLTID